MQKTIIIMLLVYLCILHTMIVWGVPRRHNEMIKAETETTRYITYKHPVLTTEELILAVNKANFLWNNWWERIDTEDSLDVKLYFGEFPGKFIPDSITRQISYRDR